MIGESRSRHEKLRLRKALVRLANCKTEENFNAFQKSFPDLCPPDVAGLRERPMGRMQEVAHALRTAWMLPDGSLRRAVLGYQVGVYYGDIVGLIASARNLPHLFRVWPRPGEPGEEKWTTFAEHRADLLQRWQERISRDAFFQLLVEALKLDHAMRLCMNPECEQPYYLRSDGGKQFCSKVCAKPSQKAAKLAWWNAHKTKLLARRKKARREKQKDSAKGEIK